MNVESSWALLDLAESLSQALVAADAKTSLTELEERSDGADGGHRLVPRQRPPGRGAPLGECPLQVLDHQPPLR